MMSVDLASVSDIAFAEQYGSMGWTPLGKYEITGLLGVGGMGVVLKGHDPSIERDVAIKVLPADLSANEVRLASLSGRSQKRRQTQPS